MIREMRPGDFERLWAEHAERLFAFLVYRTGDRSLAEDVLADAFEQAYRARARFDRRKASERTWLYTIALNRLRDLQRRRGAEARAYERALAGVASGQDDAGLDAVESRDVVVRAMAVLSDEEREALSLRYGAELSLKEIAKTVGESVTTVEGRVYRGLRKLRGELS